MNPPSLALSPPSSVHFGHQGRGCIVTGGAQGIGEACVRRFAAEGAHAVIVDVDDARGQALSLTTSIQTAWGSRIFSDGGTGLAGGLWLAGQGQTPVAANTLYGAKLVGNLFLDLLRMVLVPLVFSSIVVGVANLRAHDQMHRVWTTTLAFFFATASLARRGQEMRLTARSMQQVAIRY